MDKLIMDNRKKTILVFYLIIWLFCYILYPAWHIPVSVGIRIGIALLFIVWFSGSTFLFKRFLEAEQLQLFSERSLKSSMPSQAGTGPVQTKGKIHDLSYRNFNNSDTAKNREAIFLSWLGVPVRLWAAWTIIVLAQIYPLVYLTISSTRSDEHYHAAIALPVVSKIESVARQIDIPLRFSLWLFIIISLLIFINYRQNILGFFRKKAQPLNLGRVYIFILPAAFLYVLVLNSSRRLDQTLFYEHFWRFPPLGKITSLGVYLLLGTGHFQAKLPSLLFCLATSYLIYRMVCLYRSTETAFVSAVLFLLFPLIFYYSHLVYLNMGEVFFVSLCVYFFLRYKKSGSGIDLILSVLSAATGFLYRWPVLMGLIIIMFCYFLDIGIDKLKGGTWQRLQPKAMTGIKICVFGLALIIPGYILSCFYSNRYPVNFLNLLSWDKLSANILSIPGNATFITLFLFLLSLAYAFIKKADILTWVSAAWFLLWMVFVVMSVLPNDARFMMAGYVPIAIIIGQFLGGFLPDLLDKKPIFQTINSAIPLVVFIYLGIACLFLPLGGLEARYNLKRGSHTEYLPYNEAFKYITEKLPPHSKIVATMVCEPSHFYAYLYGIDMNRIYRGNWAADLQGGIYPPEDREQVIPQIGFIEGKKIALFQPIWSSQDQTLDNLYEFCVKFDYGYVMFPRGERWLLWAVNEKLIENIAGGQDDRFSVIKIFRFGCNEIVLARVRMDNR